MMEKIVQTTESHHQINYLIRVNKWYNQKQKIIDENSINKPIPPQNYKPIIICQKEFIKQKSIKKKREEVEKDNSPVKRIKIEKGPLIKLKFPPINKMNASLNKGTNSPFKKFYKDNSVLQKNKVESEDNFKNKIILLKKVSAEDYQNTPYKSKFEPEEYK